MSGPPAPTPRPPEISLAWDPATRPAGCPSRSRCPQGDASPGGSRSSVLGLRLLSPLPPPSQEPLFPLSQGCPRRPAGRSTRWVRAAPRRWATHTRAPTPQLPDQPGPGVVPAACQPVHPRPWRRPAPWAAPGPVRASPSLAAPAGRPAVPSAGPRAGSSRAPCSPPGHGDRGTRGCPLQPPSPGRAGHTGGDGRRTDGRRDCRRRKSPREEDAATGSRGLRTVSASSFKGGPATGRGQRRHRDCKRGLPTQPPAPRTEGAVTSG